MGFGRRQANRHHLTATAGALHDATAMVHNAHGVVERQHARYIQRGQFADAVANDCVRRDAPLLPQRRQRHLNREDRRLRNLRLHDARGLSRRIDGVQHRQIRERAKLRIDGDQCIMEYGLPCGQLAAHARPLRPLTAEHERNP